MESFESLVRKARSQDVDLEERQAAFGELVKRFQDMVFDQARRVLEDTHLAQDTAQEAFITAYENLDQLQNSRAFPSWLKRIVVTECNRVTRRKRLPVETLDDAGDLPDPDPDPAALAEARDLRDKILAAIEALPEHEREVIELFYLDGYSQNDIAGMVGIPVKTIKSRLYSSRQHLQKRMREIFREDLEEECTSGRMALCSRGNCVPQPGSASVSAAYMPGGLAYSACVPGMVSYRQGRMSSVAVRESLSFRVVPCGSVAFLNFPG